MKVKKNDPLTKCNSNKGFSGNSSILPRSNFGVCGQESSPQSLTADTLHRWQQYDKNGNKQEKFYLIH